MAVKLFITGDVMPRMEQCKEFAYASGEIFRAIKVMAMDSIKGKPIFYGLGNFYFSQRKLKHRNELWNYGYAVMLTLNKSIDFELIPYIQDIKGLVLRNTMEFNNEMERLNHIYIYKEKKLSSIKIY